MFELSEAERRLLPTDTDVAEYARAGWYLSPKLLTDAEVDDLERAASDYYAGIADRELPLRPARLADWRTNNGDVQRNNDYIHYTSDAFRRILTKPLIGAVAARLAATTSIRIFQATLLYKPPIPNEPSNIVSWHFDKYYWGTCSSDHMLTAFIPFHDCGEEFGTIVMVTGSHRWQDRHGPARPAVPAGDLWRDSILESAARMNNTVPDRVSVSIPRGHMTFHHCLLYHGSGHNVSGRPRRSVSLHLQDASNTWRDVAESPGRQEPYKHDALVRRAPDGRPDYSDPDFCPVVWARADPDRWPGPASPVR